MNESCHVLVLTMFLFIAFDVCYFFLPVVCRNDVTIPFIVSFRTLLSVSCLVKWLFQLLHSAYNALHQFRKMPQYEWAALYSNWMHTIETSQKNISLREWNVRISSIADNPIRALKCLTFGFVVSLSYWLFKQWCGKSPETKATQRVHKHRHTHTNGIVDCTS